MRPSAREICMTVVLLALMVKNTHNGETDTLATVEDFGNVFGLKPRPDFPQKGTPEYEALREEWKYTPGR